MTEHYSIVRKIKKMPQAIPGKIIEGISSGLTREKNDERHTLQQEVFRRNETKARELARSLPPETVFTLIRRCDEDPTGEIKIPIKIDKTDNEKQISLRLIGTENVETKSYPAFCLETGLMIRDSNNLLEENKDKLQEIYQTTVNLPQTR